MLVDLNLTTSNSCDNLRIRERAISPAVTAKSILAEV